MKITVKLVFVMLTSTALVLAINAYLQARREVKAFQTDMVHDARQVGQVLERVLSDTWHTHGQAGAFRLVTDANINDAQMRFRWIPLGTTDTPPDHLDLAQRHIVSLRRGTSVSLTAPDALGQSLHYLYVPVRVGNEVPGVLEITESLAPVHQYVYNTMLYTVLVWVGMVALSGGLMLCIGNVVIGRPMHRVIEKTQRVGAGDLDGPLEFHTHDEFAMIAVALNQMCEQLKTAHEAVRAEMVSRLQTLEQLRHADRLKTIGTLMSGMAHELGTPLNVVSGRASLIASGRLSPPEVTDSVRIIKEQVQRMAGMIRQVLDFARRKTPKRTAIDLRVLAQHTLDMMQLLAKQQHAVLTLKNEAAPIHVQVDAGQVQQVLMNLITNAWQAMPQGGHIDIDVRRLENVQPLPGCTQSRKGYACVSVTDQGKGIPEEDVKHIFDPFFTTKDVGQGTGLGLSVAYGIVRDHGGWIEAVSQPGHGACFSVYLPMEDEACPDAS